MGLGVPGVLHAHDPHSYGPDLLAGQEKMIPAPEPHDLTKEECWWMTLEASAHSEDSLGARM